MILHRCIVPEYYAPALIPFDLPVAEYRDEPVQTTEYFPLEKRDGCM